MDKVSHPFKTFNQPALTGVKGVSFYRNCGATSVGVLQDNLVLSTELIIKNWFMLSVRTSSYGCTREVWRARKKRKSCSRRSREQL